MRRVLFSMGAAALGILLVNLHFASGQEVPADGISLVPNGPQRRPGNMNKLYGDLIRSQTQLIKELVERVEALEDRVAQLEDAEENR